MSSPFAAAAAIAVAFAAISASFSGVQVHASGPAPAAGSEARIAMAFAIFAWKYAGSKLTFVSVAKSDSAINFPASVLAAPFAVAAVFRTAIPLQR